MIALLTLIFEVAKAIVQLVLDIRSRSKEAAGRVKAKEEEKADVAKLISEKKGMPLAQKARTLRLVTRELLNDPKLHKAISSAAARRGMVPPGTQLPNDRPPAE